LRLPPQYQNNFTDPCSVVERREGSLEAFPYHSWYETDLAEIADDLKKAAKTIKNEELKNYLTVRAETLVDGNYRKGDSEWVTLKNSPLELVLGPYGHDADQLMGLKATYSGMLLVVERKRNAVFEVWERHVDQFAKIFPQSYADSGASRKVVFPLVVSQIYAAGSASQGAAKSSYYLPTDPWVRENVGCKPIIAQNILQAQFDQCVVKAAQKVFAEAPKVDFEAYFYLKVLREMSFSMGPISEANSEGSIVGARNDVAALLMLLKISGKHLIPAFSRKTIVDTYLAGLIQGMRSQALGVNETASVTQFNWFLERGVVSQVGDNKLKTDSKILESEAQNLLGKLCELQTTASPSEVQKFLSGFGQRNEIIRGIMGALESIPLDIRVRYPL
jgi:hypothetical protein